MSLPDDIRVTLSTTISNFERDRMKSGLEPLKRQLRDRLAGVIAQFHIEEDRTQYETRLHMDLIIATPDQFWHVVERQVQLRLAADKGETPCAL